MVRLYRKGVIKDWGSSWFPTIREATEYDGTEEDIIGIIRLSEKNFKRDFEQNGVGYRPKSKENFADANPVIQYLAIDQLEELIENPITSRFYADAETMQRLESL